MSFTMHDQQLDLFKVKFIKKIQKKEKPRKQRHTNLLLDIKQQITKNLAYIDDVDYMKFWIYQSFPMFKRALLFKFQGILMSERGT